MLVVGMMWTGRVVDSTVGEAQISGLVELERARGDVVRVIDWASGWLWCRSRSGHFGWIPADSVEASDAEAPWR